MTTASRTAAADIRLLILDVDGTLTDGRLYFGPAGRGAESVSRARRPASSTSIAAGIEVAVISGRSSKMVSVRCRELGVEHVVQGAEDKVAAFEKLRSELKIDASDCACVGDDSADVPLMKVVRLAFAVADAHRRRDPRGACCDVATGGHGAVREVCDYLLDARKTMIFRILAALVFIGIIVGSFCPRRGTARDDLDDDHPGGGEAGSGLFRAQRDAAWRPGADGLPVYTLNADVIRQHPGDGVEFEQVQMSFRDNEGQLWKGRADQGELTTDTGKVELSGDVHVNGLLPGSDQTGGPGNREAFGGHTRGHHHYRGARHGHFGRTAAQVQRTGGDT